MTDKSVESYQEAVKAIHDIVFGAKIPIITMVAILEIIKHQLLTEHILGKKETVAKRFFDKLQECIEEKHEGSGVS